jgi:hypothetical protein
MKWGTGIEKSADVCALLKYVSLMLNYCAR